MVCYLKSCRTSLRQIIEKRIGLETFTEKLSQVPKTESYTKAAKKPHVNYKQSSEVTFDYEFTRTFKALEGQFADIIVHWIGKETAKERGDRSLDGKVF